MSDIWSLPNDRARPRAGQAAVDRHVVAPRTDVAERRPAAGLQALLADPLWMIGRQWQFGELRGEDGGTPISTMVDIEHAPLSRLFAARRTATTTRTAPSTSSTKRCRSKPASRPRGCRSRPSGSGPPPACSCCACSPRPASTRRDRRSWRRGGSPRRRRTTRAARSRRHRSRPVTAGRVPDAARVAAALVRCSDGDGPLTGLPAGFDDGGGAVAEETARTVLADWLRWYEGYSSDPAAGPARRHGTRTVRSTPSPSRRSCR